MFQWAYLFSTKVKKKDKVLLRVMLKNKVFYT